MNLLMGQWWLSCWVTDQPLTIGSPGSQFPTNACPKLEDRIGKVWDATGMGGVHSCHVMNVLSN